MELKIIIIEDEALAVSRLKRLLSELDDTFEILTEAKSIKDFLNWFSKNEHTKIDLIFSDIQLTDGISFEIFEKINISAPIIFTTAFDEYLMKAFKTNGIEYLLKPFGRKDLDSAIQKYKTIIQSKSTANFSENSYNDLFKRLQHNFPTFISYNRDKIIPVKGEGIVYFSLSNQVVYAHNEQGKCVLNETLNQVQEKLPEHYFYRANRQCIIHRKYIDEIENYFGGRLKIKLKIKQQEEIIISKDNCKSFKDWLQG